MNRSKHFDAGSLLVMAITLVLFLTALFTTGFTHDLLQRRPEPRHVVPSGEDRLASVGEDRQEDGPARHIRTAVVRHRPCPPTQAHWRWAVPNLPEFIPIYSTHWTTCHEKTDSRQSGQHRTVSSSRLTNSRMGPSADTTNSTAPSRAPTKSTAELWLVT